jgi:hypothetical protein
MWRKDRLTGLVELWNKELGKQYPMRENKNSIPLFRRMLFFSN